MLGRAERAKGGHGRPLPACGCLSPACPRLPAPNGRPASQHWRGKPCKAPFTLPHEYGIPVWVFCPLWRLFQQQPVAEHQPLQGSQACTGCCATAESATFVDTGVQRLATQAGVCAARGAGRRAGTVQPKAARPAGDAAGRGAQAAARRTRARHRRWAVQPRLAPSHVMRPPHLPSWTPPPAHTARLAGAGK